MNESSWRDGLFEEFRDLIEIEICSTRAKVPENNKLLRCFQFIKMDSVSVGDYCWNGDCTNCQVWYTSDKGDTKTGLACKLYARPGMIITELSKNLKNDLIE